MRITLTDGRALDAPDPLPIDIVMMERQYKVGAGVLNTPSGQRVEYALFLAWHALKRGAANEVPAKFDDFLAELADFEDEAETLESLTAARDDAQDALDVFIADGAEGGSPLDETPPALSA